MWEIIIALVIAAIIVMFAYKGCGVKCGCKLCSLRDRAYSTNTEHMTGGLGSINALALYNHSNNCHEGNAMGSSSPFCTTTGYVLT